MMEQQRVEKKCEWYARPWVMFLGVIILFAVISIAYFTPAAFEGRVLFQADGAAASGTGRDVVRYEEESGGHRSLWTGSLFGGMPMYQISPSYPSTKAIKLTQELYRLEAPLDIMPGDSYLLFMMLIGFYIFMRSWKMKPVLSIGGAVLWTFSSYFLILIQAGHLWKLLALAYIPPTISGLVWAFHRRRYLLGFFITGLFSALQIYSNHIQMSYYFAFLMLAMIIAWAVEAGRKKEWRHFAKALATVVIGGLVGISVNATSLYHTYEYSKETMRGGSELSSMKSDATGNSTGLDKAYITQWSYGIDEMLTFLIPDAKGGASGQIGMGEPALSKAGDQQSQYFVAQQNRYWGNQPFTAGPVYVGAFVLLMAIFGMLVAKGPMKWAFVSTLILTVMLSWGHNFMGLTSFFIDHVPLYDKFRTPSSILVVAEMIIPIFAIWGLVIIIRDPEVLKAKRWYAIISIALTLGVALLIWLFPSLSGGMLSDMEQEGFGQYLDQAPELGFLISSLESVRASILKADALRSVIVIIIGIGLISLFYYKKLSDKWMVPLVILLCFIDLWSVDKRYLNDEMYLPALQVRSRVEQRTPIDEKILQDKGQFRVMNLAVNTFNDATTSYHHRSVGGYHAAKLQRYQEVIEGYLAEDRDLNVLRALNTKYYILPDSLAGLRLVEDAGVYGDAWFVSSIKKVSSADEEFSALRETPLDRIAIIAPPFSEMVGSGIKKDSLASVQLIEYSPDRIKYKSSNTEDGLVVFSEIFYPKGWHATIDGIPAELLRADYILRAMEVPKGEHVIEMWFDPKSIHITEAIAFTGNIILLLSVLGVIGFYFYKNRKK